MIAIGAAARARGFFTRPEFLEVCLWKTVRSKSRVARNSKDEIEEATRLALSAKSEALRIQIPQALYGVSWATASVLLHLAHTEPYPILDYRALEALGVTGVVVYTLPFWVGYVSTCRRLAAEVRSQCARWTEHFGSGRKKPQPDPASAPGTSQVSTRLGTVLARSADAELSTAHSRRIGAGPFAVRGCKARPKMSICQCRSVFGELTARNRGS